MLVNTNDLAQVRRMLQARPELANSTMSYGDEHRPIHYAVMKRSPEMVGLLMQRGANARQGIHPHRDATTAWTIAKERGYEEIVAIIEEEEQRRGEASSAPEAEVIGDEGARAAVASGDVKWLRARHAEGNLVNPIRWDGRGLLTVAVRNDRPEMLLLLLDFGFDPDERVSSGEGAWVAYSQGYPHPRDHSGVTVCVKSLYLKLRDRGSFEFALVSAAIVVRQNGGHIDFIRIAMGGIGTVPWRCHEAEKALHGKAPTLANFRKAAEVTLRNTRPQSQNGFKVELARRCLTHALTQATAQA